MVAGLAAACVVWVSPSAGTPAACDPGTRVVEGTTIYVYCGPARATVKVGGKTYRIFGGKCKRMREAKLYVVDVGIITVAGGKPTARYLGIRVQVAKAAYNVAPNVVKVGNGMRSGTFSGDALGRAGRVSGSWTC